MTRYIYISVPLYFCPPVSFRKVRTEANTDETLIDTNCVT